jgi:cytochrome c oxidase subunit III
MEPAPANVLLTQDTSHGGVLAHHFEDLEQQREAATLGMWTFLVTEVMFFGGLFGAYAVYRHLFHDAFVRASHHLDAHLGGVNTAVLIGSSFTMVLAVHAASLRRRNLLFLWLWATILLGSVFLGIKYVEYHDKWVHHLVPGPNFEFEGVPGGHEQIFFALYFTMTGLHALHMLIGMVVLAWFSVQALRGRFDEPGRSGPEIAGLYWHFVDLVWIFLFPMLYLIGRHG